MNIFSKPLRTPSVLHFEGSKAPRAEPRGRKKESIEKEGLRSAARGGAIEAYGVRARMQAISTSGNRSMKCCAIQFSSS